MCCFVAIVAVVELATMSTIGTMEQSKKMAADVVDLVGEELGEHDVAVEALAADVDVVTSAADAVEESIAGAPVVVVVVVVVGKSFVDVVVVGQR